MRHRTLTACLATSILWITGCGGGGSGGADSVAAFDASNRDRAALWWAGQVRQLVAAKESGNSMRVEEAVKMLDAARAPLVGQRIRFLFNVWTTNPDLPSTVWSYTPISKDGVWVGLLHRAEPGRIRVGIQHPGRRGARAFQLKPGVHLDPAILRDLSERSVFEVSGTVMRTEIDRLDTWHMGTKRFTDAPTLVMYINDIKVENVNP